MQKIYVTLFVHKHLEKSFQWIVTHGRFLFAALFVVI